MPVRRIVCCKSCRKRFATSSGSTLCLSCRPKDSPPTLTYGGESMSILPNNSPRRDATKTDNNFNCNSDERVNNDGGNVVSTAQTSDPIDQHEEKITLLEPQKSLGVTLKEDFGQAHDKLSPSNNFQVPDVSARKRKQFDTEDFNDDEVLKTKDDIYDMENDNSCYNNVPEITGNTSQLSAQAEPIKDKQLEEQHVTRAVFVSAADILNNAEYLFTKKQKTELTEEKDTTKCMGDNCLENVKEMPCSDTSNHHKQSLSLEDKDISPIIARQPKVSLGSTVCDDDSYSESDDEMDIMIGQESRWSKLKSSPQGDVGAASESIHHTESSTNHPEEDGEDSDIEYIGTSGSQPIDNVAPQIDDYCNENIHELDDDSVDNPGIGSLETNTQYQVNGGESSCSGGRDTNNCDGDLFDEYVGCTTASQERDRDDLDVKPPPEPHNSPKKDVCYICGSNLSRLKFKGRVAHMKRCSSKHGKVSMDDGGDLDANFVPEGAEEVTAKAAKATPKQASGVTNPYSKNHWHGGANAELELNKTMTPPTPQSKQTMLKHFFKAPVRSLTNVLLAGARQASKGKAIAASKAAAVTSSSGYGKQPYRKGHWRSNTNRRNGTCPAFKRITGTDFICDGFHYATRALSENYFLTHFHSDHYGGITKTWSDGTIYCSLPTANLVHQQLGVEMKYLHPIPMNTPTIIASKGRPVQVTLLDANHCPGAIMFLFELGNKRILHVGDFRWNRELMMQMPQLRAFGNSNPRLDELFLDTTYCNKKYSLPTQQEAISAAIEVAEHEMAISKKDVKMKTLFLFGSYTIGKERIYLSVAERLKMKVYVDSRRYRILSSLEWPKERMQMFTTNRAESCIWVVPLGSINFKQMVDHLEEGNKTKAFTAPYSRVVGFRPTGWTYSAKDKKQRTLSCGRRKPGGDLISSKTSGRYSVHGVPYSEHSSFPELVDCLRCLKPKKIIPTVSVSKSEEQVEMLLNEL